MNKSTTRLPTEIIKEIYSFVPLYKCIECNQSLRLFKYNFCNFTCKKKYYHKCLSVVLTLVWICVSLYSTIKYIQNNPNTLLNFVCIWVNIFSFVLCNTYIEQLYTK